ncbi:Six-hairpin glycosidase-like protein [Elsinoe ampelina]|uniref:Six-hairpin glycosidase-like protein n=1 Tax=Elsinoe ampelina TaxID=302913 RepID=A0A6A6G4C2_9PEZI|nr:Six-hairpin glycosidase-like protein [Elsinoe ampelina]
MMQTPPRSPKPGEKIELQRLYDASVSAKLWNVAAKSLGETDPPQMMPEYTLPGEKTYTYSHASFWTSGFFGGSLSLLHERQRRWPDRVPQHIPDNALRRACQWWTHALHAEASRTDSHDLGFMIQPWAQLGWKLDRDERCLASLVVAANALASRFNPTVGCIRSWDTCFTRRYAFADPRDDFLVIIDNMMNLDLLYLVADLRKDQRLADIASKHAMTTLRSHIRADGSTCHVVNFNQHDGSVKEKITNQGFSDDSCWSRGQAWGITGFVQCYRWTKNQAFLEASRALADYFLERAANDKLPPWDFDAPEGGPPDSSAAMITAYGLLLLHEAIPNDTKYLSAALQMTQNVVRLAMTPSSTYPSDPRQPRCDDDETILVHATINNYEYAPRRWADHGLVYADYFFMLVGNKLLEMGLVG